MLKHLCSWATTGTWFYSGTHFRVTIKTPFNIPTITKLRVRYCEEFNEIVICGEKTGVSNIDGKTRTPSQRRRKGDGDSAQRSDTL
jgi:hypothetical protein